MDHQKGRCTQAPDINFLIVSGATEHLWRHVRGRSIDALQFTLLGELRGQSEIAKFDRGSTGATEQKVVRFDVSVNYSLLVYVLDSEKHLREYPAQVCLHHGAHLRKLVHQRVLALFHDHVEEVALEVAALQRYAMVGDAHCLPHFDLTQSNLHSFGIGLLRGLPVHVSPTCVNYLDSQVLVANSRLGSSHLTKRTLAKLFPELVVFMELGVRFHWRGRYAPHDAT
mmetsp:Transcript_172168/g.551857  ORF Transcript_172168/g.551857 Transcript_172168/m.551857 type:complete len:226 (-) Transcript_172168:140-817(-)